MANFHSDAWIMARLREHYEEALTLFPENRIVGIFLQGSQNYGLDYEGSDIDTKLIVLPTFEDIAFNKRAVSTTHVRENDEHIDLKDLRLYLQIFRKQNLNFLEILFTPYAIVNPTYKSFWDRLVAEREKIAHYDLHQAIKSMKGIAMEKYHAMEHHYPARMHMIEKYGYDPKQLHHLLRVEDYLERYISGESYESCLDPKDKADYLVEVKKGKHSLDEARELADAAKAHVEEMCTTYLETVEKSQDPEVDKLLDGVQYDAMKLALAIELQEEEYYD